MDFIKHFNKEGRLIATIKTPSNITEAQRSKVNNGKDLIKPKESKLKKARVQIAMLLIEKDNIDGIDKRDFLAKKAAKKEFYKSLNRKGLRKR